MKKNKKFYLNNFGTKRVVLISQDRGKKRGGKKSMCSANVSVIEYATLLSFQQIKIFGTQNTPVVLTCRAEGSGRNSASSPKIKSGGSSGYWALKIISPVIQKMSVLISLQTYE